MALVAWKEWRGVRGNFDAMRRQIQPIVQTNIEPTPMGIDSVALDLGDGSFAVDIQISEHHYRPYQNTITGGRKVRTGSQNSNIPRDKLPGYFLDAEAQKKDLILRADRERSSLSKRGIMADGTYLDISVLPREYRFDHPPLDFRVFPRFSGCVGGSETMAYRDGRNHKRLFIADDWFTQLTIIHPFKVEHNRIE
jgi:hypothetical protein